MENGIKIHFDAKNMLIWTNICIFTVEYIQNSTVELQNDIKTQKIMDMPFKSPTSKVHGEGNKSEKVLTPAALVV